MPGRRLALQPVLSYLGGIFAHECSNALEERRLLVGPHRLGMEGAKRLPSEIGLEDWIVAMEVDEVEDRALLLRAMPVQDAPHDPLTQPPMKGKIPFRVAPAE